MVSTPGVSHGPTRPRWFLRLRSGGCVLHFLPDLRLAGDRTVGNRSDQALRFCRALGVRTAPSLLADPVVAVPLAWPADRGGGQPGGQRARAAVGSEPAGHRLDRQLAGAGPWLVRVGTDPHDLPEPRQVPAASSARCHPAAPASSWTRPAALGRTHFLSPTADLWISLLTHPSRLPRKGGERESGVQRKTKNPFLRPRRVFCF